MSLKMKKTDEWILIRDTYRVIQRYLSPLPPPEARADTLTEELDNRQCWMGVPNKGDAGVLTLTIEAARVLCGLEYKATHRLLKLAIGELERKQPELAKTRTASIRVYYAHGDYCSPDQSVIYCVRCDLFLPTEHLNDLTQHPVPSPYADTPENHRRAHLRRCIQSLKSSHLDKRPKGTKNFFVANNQPLPRIPKLLRQAR